MNKEEFAMEKEILNQRLDYEKEIHSLKVKELEYQRETNRLKHEQELERGRIKSAEIRKSQLRMGNKEAFKYWAKIKSVKIAKYQWKKDVGIHLERNLKEEECFIVDSVGK